MKSGWLSILQNEKQLLVHSRNVNNVARIRATHNALASRNQRKWKHTDCGPKRLKQDEQCVQDLIACMQEFDSFPTMLLVSSVLMTPMTQPTPLKMTSETYEYRVGLMSPIST